MQWVQENATWRHKSCENAIEGYVAHRFSLFLGLKDLKGKVSIIILVFLKPKGCITMGFGPERA